MATQHIQLQLPTIYPQIFEPSAPPKIKDQAVEARMRLRVGAFRRKFGTDCKKCGLPEFLSRRFYSAVNEVHHKTYKYERGREPDHALVVLCRRCHELEHFGSSALLSCFEIAESVNFFSNLSPQWARVQEKARDLFADWDSRSSASISDTSPPDSRHSA